MVDILEDCLSDLVLNYICNVFFSLLHSGNTHIRSFMGVDAPEKQYDR